MTAAFFFRLSSPRMMPPTPSEALDILEPLLMRQARLYGAKLDVPAADFAQELRVRFFLSYRRFDHSRGPLNLEAYLTTIARCAFADGLKEKYKARRVLTGEDANMEFAFETEPERSPPDTDGQLDQPIIQTTPARTLAGLRPRYRRAIELRYGLKNGREMLLADIGKRLGGVSYITAIYLLKRALAEMKADLEPIRERLM